MNLKLFGITLTGVILLASVLAGPLVAVPLAVLLSVALWAPCRMLSVCHRLSFCLLTCGITTLAIVGVEKLRERFYKMRANYIMEQISLAQNKQNACELMQREVFPGMKLLNWDDKEFEVKFRDRFDLLDWWTLSSKQPGWELN